MTQRTLFELPTKTRAKSRVMMHVCDAGPAETGGHMVRFHCKKCDRETDWTWVKNITEGMRGKPCPRCNATKGHTG